MAEQHFMFQLATFEENAFAVTRTDVFRYFVFINAKLSPIAGNPVFVQVKNHGVLPAGITPKLVKMFLVKTPLFVGSIVKLIACNSRIAGLIKKKNKGIHEVKESVFVLIFMGSIKPEDFVGSNAVIYVGFLPQPSFGFL